MYGLDVIGTQEDRTYSYHIGNRQFELAELKLLVDSAQSAKFITAKKSNELIKKIEGLASKYEASQLHRQVFVAGRVKTMNESSSTYKSSTNNTGLSSSYSNESNSTNKSSYSGGTKKSTTTKKSTYDSYDDGYDDIYMDGDYDYDRYDRDSDYADGVDDAMDEYGEDW